MRSRPAANPGTFARQPVTERAKPDLCAHGRMRQPRQMHPSPSACTSRHELIFRSVGSEGGEAEVLNNLGLVYETQGDLATAEKMHREALAIFQVLDDKSQEAGAILNVANERMGQGDLPGAIRLYEESLQLLGKRSPRRLQHRVCSPIARWPCGRKAGIRTIPRGLAEDGRPG